MPPSPASDVPSSLLTRRRVLLGGAAAGTALLLSPLPVGAQDPAAPVEPDVDPTVPPGEPAHPEDEAPEGALTGRSFDTLLSESPDRGIMFPVLPASAASWIDSYGACRSGCSRQHQGQDLMAPKMTKLLAVVSGTIVEFRHRSSGNSLYIRGDDGWFYCYLHINNDRPGTDDGSNLAQHAWAPKLQRYVGNEAAARGVRVLRGEHVAYVGDSGNAEGSGSHLHFEIRKPASGTFSSETQRLWASPSVNPRVSLQKAAPPVERPQVDPAVFTPWTNADDFIRAQYQDFLGRAPSSADLRYYAEELNSGRKTPDWLMQVVLQSAEADSKTQAVGRIYKAAYDRLPDSAGFTYWLDQRRAGWSLTRIAEQFSRAPEFAQRYGSLSDAGYVDLIYRNVLGRSPDASGRDYWISQLRAGTTRGKVLIHFSESAENKAKHKNLMHVIGAYGVMLRRVPTAEERTIWVDYLDEADSTRNMVNMLRMGAEYRGRHGG